VLFRRTSGRNILLINVCTDIVAEESDFVKCCGNLGAFIPSLHERIFNRSGTVHDVEDEFFLRLLEILLGGEVLDDLVKVFFGQFHRDVWVND